MGESTALGTDHTVMTHTVRDHISPQSNNKTHEGNSFEKSTKIRLDVEGIDSKELSSTYSPSVVVNINTSMTINAPTSSTKYTPECHTNGSAFYYNDKSIVHPGVQGSYPITDPDKNLKQENSPSITPSTHIPDLNTYSASYPYYSLHSFGQHGTFPQQPTCASFSNFHQIPGSFPRQNPTNFSPFNYSRNFDPPMLQVSHPSISIRQPQSGYTSRDAVRTDTIPNGEVSPTENQPFTDYNQHNQSEAVPNSPTQLSTSSNVIPHYTFPHHPTHYPFYSYPTTDMSSIHSPIFPYCNNYQQYYLARSQGNNFPSTEQHQVDDKKLIGVEKDVPFDDTVNSNLNIGSSNIIESASSPSKPRKSSKCQCPNCTNRPKNISSKIVKKHACHWPNCGKTYGKTSHLKSHIRQHQGIRPFVCPTKTCMKSFTRSDELSRHVRIHTGDKRFNCASCTKGFTRSDHLKKHEKTHRGNLAKNDTENNKNIATDSMPIKTNTLMKDEVNQPLNPNEHYLPESSSSVFHINPNNKEREINDKNRCNGGVVSICDAESKRANSNIDDNVVLPKKGRPAKKKVMHNQENQPLDQGNQSCYHPTNVSSSDVLGSSFISGSRTNPPLQELPTYHRGENNFGTNSQPKQEQLLPSRNVTSNFQSLYALSNAYPEQNRLMPSNSLAMGYAQNYHYKNNEC